MNFDIHMTNSSTRAPLRALSAWRPLQCLILSFMCMFSASAFAATDKAQDIKYTSHPPAPERQSAKDAERKSAGCVTCHTGTDRHTMHANPGVVLGCTDCHGGDVAIARPKDSEYKGTYRH